MKNIGIGIVAVLGALLLIGCAKKYVNYSAADLTIVNRALMVPIAETATTVALNNKPGAGLAMLNEVNFASGTIELELKGEDNPGKSFVGFAFNIQNDSTYEAIYFRPFNFRAKEEIRRQHSVQYINHPKQDWRFLRTNHEGVYEADYPRKPSPDDWFGVELRIDENRVTVKDKMSNTELLSVQRIGKQVSTKVGFWTGHNSKGEFRNLSIRK